MSGLSRIAYLRGDAEGAIEILEKVVEINPGTAGPSAYNQIGMIHLRAGRTDDAREAYQSSLEIDGLNGRAHDGLANVLLAEDKQDEAKQTEAMGHLQLALKYNPLQLAAASTLGGLLREKGALLQGEAVCKQVLTINPKFAMALNNLGLIYRQQSKLDEAEETYRKAIEAAPRMVAPRINLAQLLLEKNDEAGAAVQFLEAVQGNRNDVLALTNLATYYYRRQKLAEASRLYRRAVWLKPDYAMAHKYLGLIYASVDRPRGSVRHLELALQHDPDDTDADSIRQVVSKMQELAANRPPEEAPFPAAGAGKISVDIDQILMELDPPQSDPSQSDPTDSEPSATEP